MSRLRMQQKNGGTQLATVIYVQNSGINPEKCFKFWVRNKGDCANCIRVCVFNKPNTWFHSFVRWHVRNLPQFDSIYLWMDDLFGFGRRMKMEDVWK